MSKAGGILALIGGVFAVLSALATLAAGGIGAVLSVEGADTIVGFGWGGIIFSFLVIILGAVAFTHPRPAGIGLIVCSIAGALLGGTLVGVMMVLALIGGILCLFEKARLQPTNAGVPISTAEQASEIQSPATASSTTVYKTDSASKKVEEEGATVITCTVSPSATETVQVARWPLRNMLIDTIFAFVVPIYGIVAGIYRLRESPTRNQGAVLLLLAISGTLVGIIVIGSESFQQWNMARIQPVPVVKGALTTAVATSDVGNRPIDFRPTADENVKQNASENAKSEPLQGLIVPKVLETEFAPLDYVPTASSILLDDDSRTKNRKILAEHMDRLSLSARERQPYIDGLAAAVQAAESREAEADDAFKFRADVINDYLSRTLHSRSRSSGN